MPNEFDDLPLLDGMDVLPEGAFDLVGIDGDGGAGWDRLVGTVRRERRRRRVVNAARWVFGVAAAFVAGFGFAEIRDEWDGKNVAVTVSSSVERTDVENGNARGEATGGEPMHRDMIRRDMPTSVSSDRVHPLLLRSRVARAEPAEQRRLLRLAGDIYLDRYDDVRGAVYCYQQLLELEAAWGAPEPRDDDSWLLANLRLGREPSPFGETN